MRKAFAGRLATVLLAVLFVAVVASVAQACPTCKDALEKNDPTHGGMVKGYFFSILFMMGTPYLVLASFCGVMYFRYRKARARRGAKAYDADTIARRAAARVAMRRQQLEA